ncbi:hypothetical protein EVAR_88491_1 [Eumeta japonica]|uniref:Uncharacterized protein n=1 Tax=Eumeta variegata TaxID=151549 RepID=A0A4C1XR85_EUMVA|nr:hypothetical protein EVAR_88491_1 [Eumeta japonica]
MPGGMTRPILSGGRRKRRANMIASERPFARPPATPHYSPSIPRTVKMFDIQLSPDLPPSTSIGVPSTFLSSPLAK